MMFDGNFGGVFDLVQRELKEFGQGCRGHGAGRTDLRLTAAFRPGYGSVGLDEIPDDPARGQSF